MTQVHRTFDPDGVPAAVGGYSHAAVVPAGTELLFVAGQVPEDLDGSVPDDFADQARLAWRNVERCLAAAGFTLDHLVKVSMYIRDRSTASPIARCVTRCWATAGRCSPSSSPITGTSAG